jgi:uncharacterized protein YgbK (DUF1537 family)
MPPRSLPADGPLVAFLGDDLTGASAAMEALAFAGLETVLFLDLPDAARLADFPRARGIGVASVARAQPPAWMDAHLPAAFRLLAGTGAPVVHYKVCSTFDSAPTVGSIGHAAEIAAEIFAGWFPMVVADPAMGRHQCFGHLFAKGPDGCMHRLDRHPSMARHPVTPMDEADLARHLARQTALPVGLVDLAAMKAGEGDAALSAALAGGARIVSLDVVDAATLAEAGRLAWEALPRPQGFAIGSQGLEAALVAHWRAAGLLEGMTGAAIRPRPARIACVSGSVSPGTAVQISNALEHGFAGIRLHAERVVDEAAWDAELARATEEALGALSAGRDPLVFTATGPDDPAVAALRTAAVTSGMAMATANERIGAGLGRVLDGLLRRAGLSRAVIAGGDTSGHAARQLGIDALTALAPLAPGAPLCRAHARERGRDGLEIALKGGQVGRPDFFRAARDGQRGQSDAA